MWIHIEGLSPAISIEQKTTSKNPRSTVGTVTEIYDYMRLLWARVGVPYSPATGKPIASQTVSQMVDRILALGEGTRLYLMAPIVRGRKGEYRKELAELQKKGFQRIKIDGAFYEIAEAGVRGLLDQHDIDVVVPRHMDFEDLLVLVCFEHADLRAKPVARRGELRVARVDVAHGHVHALREQRRGRRAVAHRDARGPEAHEMDAALLHAGREQQGLVGDAVGRQSPGPRELRVRAFAPRDDLHPETVHPQVERLVHVADADDDVGDGERCNGKDFGHGRHRSVKMTKTSCGADCGRRRARPLVSGPSKSAR